MKDSYFAIEKRIRAACEAHGSRKNTKIAPLAREFDVPVQRLRARLNGRQSRSSHPTPTKRLDQSQEAALIRWINILDSLHVPLTAGMVEASANAMIRTRSEAVGEELGDPVGKMWIYNFIKRLMGETKASGSIASRRRILAFYRPGMIDWSPSYAGSRPRISTISTRLASRLARESLKKLSPASASVRGCFRASEASS